jgi:hypothetical protein
MAMYEGTWCTTWLAFSCLALDTRFLGSVNLLCIVKLNLSPLRARSYSVSRGPKVAQWAGFLTPLGQP